MPVQLLLALLKSPAETGAVLPSSRYLAGAMAHAASGADLVIELGAGTGPVTTALLNRLPGTPLVAVEIQPGLAHRLRRRHPQVDVRQASASEVVDAHLEAPGRVVLVSSLPFRSLPPAVASATAASFCSFLLRSHERKLIQFTYQPRAPFKAMEGLQWRRITTVWRNTPPAGVWELSVTR